MKNRKVRITALIILIAFALIVYMKGSVPFPYYLDGELFIAEWVFRDTYYRGDIIGNPDFHPSFLYVNESSFAESLKSTAKGMAIDIDIERSQAENSHWAAVYVINDRYTILYSEGFLKLTFKTENLEAMKKDTLTMIELLLRTVDQELTDDKIGTLMNEEFGYDFLNEKDYDWKNGYIIGSSVRCDFDVTEENGYEFHMEDLRMGH